tara:strand:- start:2905 stop:3192 length:288 start_codon:yes stop_codon:yes gene_type:complete
MDNRYYKHGCPPLMSDGRFITSYVDSSVLNQYIRDINQICSANEFKSFLQKEGLEIMDRERKHIIENNTCDVHGKCTKDYSYEKPCRDTCKCKNN